MTVCFFGHYAPDYPRNRVLRLGLSACGVNVKHCNKDNYLSLLRRFFQVGRKSDVILVAFPGNESVPLAWLLGKLLGKKVVFDAFISRYDTKVFDRKEYTPESLRAKFAFFLDWLACFLSDHVIVDTNEHSKYFSETFNLPLSKFSCVFVGTDDGLFFPRPRRRNSKFVVGFHGYYIPLQGANFIIDAAFLLRKEKKIQFRMLGIGPDFDKCRQKAATYKLENMEFSKPVPYKDLPFFISHADVCLGGPFGTSGKAGRVIPNKVFEALAMKKPVIVGKTAATKELLTHLENCYMVERGDPKSIAMAIKALENDRRLRVKIARKGHQLFVNNLTAAAIGEQLLAILQQL